MSYFQKILLMLTITTCCIQARTINNEPKIINELVSNYNNLSPNIVNLCSDLHSQGYIINKINNSNIGIYLKNRKLIEMPINCEQPWFDKCVEWSGIQYCNNQNDQDNIAKLYFNMLGFNSRQYNNIFKTNSKYKNIKLNNIKHSYPLFKIEGSNYFMKILCESLKNVIYTDPGKMLMYRLFLASAEYNNTPTLEFLQKKFKDVTDESSELLEYNFPIVIKQTNNAISSIRDSMIGISLNHYGIHSEASHDTTYTKFGTISRPIETSIYHELLHCFHQLYLLQLLRLNKPNKFEYKLNKSANIKHTFDLFFEYNKIPEPINQLTIFYIFQSLLIYRDSCDSLITSSEEFNTIIGIFPGSKYYYPGAELSENLFRLYTHVPIRDTHMINIKDPYMQNYSFVQHIKSRMKELNLKYSEIYFHLPMKNSNEVKNMTHSDFINFCNNRATEITNTNFYSQSDNLNIIKGYENCYYFPLDNSLTNGMEHVRTVINEYPKFNLLLHDMHAIIDKLFKVN